MEENLQTSPWIWCVSVIETFTFVLMCVCVGVCHISQNCTKKKIPKLKNGKQNLFMGHVMLLSMSMMIGRKKQATVRQKNIIYTIKKNLHRKKENVDKTDDLMIYMKMVVVENIF